MQISPKRLLPVRPEKLRQLGLGRDNLAEVVARRRGTDTIAQADPI